MNEINCIVMSLENGLTNQYLDISPATLSILEEMKRKGLILGLSSSRSIPWLLKYLKTKRIPSLFSFLLGCDGTQYCNVEEGQWTILCDFNKATLLKVAQTLESLPVSCGVEYNKELFFDKPGVYALNYTFKTHKRAKTQGFKSIPENASFSQIVITGSKPLLQKLETHFSIPDAKIIHSTSTVLDVVPARCNMYTGLELALHQFHLLPQHVLYFGTSEKDIPALENTFGVGMKGASDAVMEASVRSTKYNGAQDGIGYMINSLQMEKNCHFCKPKESSNLPLESASSFPYIFRAIDTEKVDKEKPVVTSTMEDSKPNIQDSNSSNLEEKTENSSQEEFKIPSLGYTHAYIDPNHEIVDDGQ